MTELAQFTTSRVYITHFELCFTSDKGCSRGTARLRLFLPPPIADVCQPWKKPTQVRTRPRY